MAAMAPPRRSTFLLRLPAPVAERGERLDEAARWPLALACLGLTLYLLLSDNLLVTLGIPYNVPQGAFPFKIHPGTYCIALGFVLLLRGNPWRRLVELFRLSPGLTSLAVATTATMVYALVRFGASGSGFFIDTLLAPALLGLILLRAPVAWRPSVFWIALSLLSLNAVIGIGEAATGARLVPYLAGDQPLTEEFFRATALGGHPLSNALRTTILLFAALVLPSGFRLALIPLLVIALLAFGSRTALATSMLLLLAWGVVAFMRGMASRRFDPRLTLGIALLALILPAAVGLAALHLGLGERVFREFYWDTSAQSRLLAFQIFDFPNPEEVLGGMGPARIEWALDLLRRTTTLNDIENFWILLLLQVGLVPFLFLAGSLLATVIGLARRGPAPVRLAALAFLVLASSNNSLATKSQNLAILVAVLIGATATVRREARQGASSSPLDPRPLPAGPPPASSHRGGFQLLLRSGWREDAP